MLQIFICSTPYHVLLAHLSVEYLLSKGKTETSNRIIILTESAIRNHIEDIIDKDIWDKTLFLPYQNIHKIYKTKRYLDRWISENLLDQIADKKEVFINDDKRWRNQLLLTGLDPNYVSLIEDGMGAYIKNQYPLKDKIYRGIFLKFLFGDRLVHTGAISSLPADQFFAFRKDAFPWYGKDRKLHILKFTQSNYIEKISRNISSDLKRQIESADLLILTTPLIEDRILTEEQEYNAWKKLGKIISPCSTIAVKSHPRETKKYRDRRISLINQAFKNSTISHIMSHLPAELFLFKMFSTSILFSPNSTTLANIKSIRPDLKILHGCDLFFFDFKKSSPLRRLGDYFIQIGVSSILQSK